MSEGIDFYQLFESQSSTYTYILADQRSHEAIIIDSVLETVERDLALLKEMGWTLKYIFDTHVHADHITGAAALRSSTGAKACISAKAKLECADLLLVDGQVLTFGTRQIKALSTPGHTDSCMSFLVDGMIFTGDALLIRGCGRTDFQQGSAERLYQSIHSQLFSLPNSTLVYPAHDYKGLSRSSIALEKKYNRRLGGGRSQEEFVEIMANLNLAPPQKIAVALPANLACGKVQSSEAKGAL